MFIAALLAMGFLLSPRAFMLTGSGIGFAGNWYLLVAAFILVTHIITAPSHTLNSENGKCSALVSFGYGVRLFTLAFFSCSILGIAGYAFNEVFLYWFPNFLFSFIVLGIAFLTCLLPSEITKKIQLIVILAILAGIAFLSVASLWAPSPKGADSPDFLLPYALSPFSEGLFFMAPFLIGYELYASSSGNNETSKCSYVLALCLAVLFLSIFAYAALSVSGTERLADSTVPYMIGARRILGQTGRYIMGAIIILGSYAAFTTTLLFLKAPFIFAMNRDHSEQRVSSSLGKRIVATAIPAVIVSILLLRGYAGEQITESYIAGGFALWFIFYGLSSLSAFAGAESVICKSIKFLGILACLYLAYAVLQMPEAPQKGILVAGVFSIAVTVVGMIVRKTLLR